MSRWVDLHMHTTHSDGTLSPRQLLRRCKEKNLSCVAVTDHDTVSSFEESRDEAARQGLECLSGIEISVNFEPGTLHILGYLFDPANPEFLSCLEKIQAARAERNQLILEKLNQLGFKISMDEVNQEAQRQHLVPEKQVGRPHFANVLVKKSYVRNYAEAFSQYLGTGAPAYVDQTRVSSAEAIAVVRAAGGIASLAHPKKVPVSEADFERELARLTSEGLEAIEVYSGSQDAADNQRFNALAEKYNLVATAGSDFHGGYKMEIEVGSVGSGLRAEYSIIDALRARIAKRK